MLERLNRSPASPIERKNVQGGYRRLGSLQKGCSAVFYCLLDKNPAPSGAGFSAGITRPRFIGSPALEAPRAT